ncbi:MAG: efflux RND transporter permease subunit [Phycisphaeraceae bacterium]|nr:efflux RND transporter permease subunit [Phycisphaeraceae bacterium]
MNLIKLSIKDPVTVAVGVILVLLAGVLAIQRVPIQLTPNVEDTVISVSTFWEGASPEEIEQEIVDKQEEKLQGISNLKAMTSQSQQGIGTIRLEFQVGTDKDVALREVSDKLREVPDYPENADEPVVEDSDPQNRDYIAWIILSTDDPGFDMRTMQDFALDRIKPAMERIPGVSEVNALGGVERELQIRFDPVELAQRGVTPAQFASAIRGSNRNISAGELAEGKTNVRVRTIGQYESVEDVERTVIVDTPGGPVRIGDVAEVVETYKEPNSFVRSSGREVLAINAQRETGSNVIEVMRGIRAEIARMNAPGGMLDAEARRLGLNGSFELRQVFDQTVYIDEAIALVRNNIWLGGALAVLVLVLFLRSVRSVAIIALAIPISVVGAVVALVAMGRSVNVISLAGMAFAVGMVVDNAIVVLENIFRRLELGESPRVAAYNGTREVWGAVLASTLTTIAVFIPILLIQEEAGLLFRDIALAIVAAVTLSLAVSVTVIPSAAARFLRPIDHSVKQHKHLKWLFALAAPLHRSPDWIAGLVYRLCGSWVARVVIVLLMVVGSQVAALALLPPSDYLPRGNRNLIFGMLIPPSGYNLDQKRTLAERIETTVRPYWEAAPGPNGGPPKRDPSTLPPVATFDYSKMQPGPSVTPPPIVNYFAVATTGWGMFHGAIAENDKRSIDVIPLFAEATRSEVAPGVLAFAFQMPLFRVGGATGSAVKIDFVGDDLDEVTSSATAFMMEIGQRYGFGSVQPDPANFNIPGPELRIIPDRVRLSEVGLTPEELGFAVQSNGDGSIIGEYRKSGESIDLKLISKNAVGQRDMRGMADTPIATPIGRIVPLSSLARLERTTSAPQINRVDRRRAITLEFSAPDGLPLEQAIDELGAMIAADRASGVIPETVDTLFAGSASKLAAVRSALLGDGTLRGLVNSSLFLALVVIYLLLCVLFQSFVRPLVIMASVPPATLGGFIALYLVFVWSTHNRYMPVQSLDVLTMLGFVLLIGVVVNNAILIVHQALNFMNGDTETNAPPMAAREAIRESVRSRVRPIFMSSLTSVGGMAPLVLMPGSGSELYRGLGGVVVGGLLLSTLFTLVLVPLLLSLVFDVQRMLARRPVAEARLASSA